LQQAGGRVRCGGCGHAFSALDHLSESMPEPTGDHLEILPTEDFTDDAVIDDLPDDDNLAETSRRLLETLDELAGPSDVRIEDTGVEWRVLDDVVGAAATDEDSSAQEALELEDEPKLVAMERRYDDNTPLGDDFDDDSGEYSRPPDSPKRRAEDTQDPDTSEFDEAQGDLALSEPGDWTDLLDDDSDADVIPLEVEEELAAIHSQLSSREAKQEPQSEVDMTPVELHQPVDLDKQFEMQAEAMGLDITGTYDISEDELTDEIPLLDDDFGESAEDETEEADSAEVEVIAEDETEEEDSAEVEVVAEDEAEEEDSAEVEVVAEDEAEEEDSAEVEVIAEEEPEEEDSAEVEVVAEEEPEEEDSAEVEAVAEEEPEEEDSAEVEAVAEEEPEEEDSAEVEQVAEDELAETAVTGEDEPDEDTDSDEEYRRARAESTGEFEAKIDVAARALADGEIGAWSDADAVSQSDDEDEDQDEPVEEADDFEDEEADESADDEVAADEEESDDDEAHELSPEDEALIRAIEAEDEPDGDDKPEADAVTEHVVPPQSEAEMTVNMEIDAELMAAAATEQQSDEKSVAEAFGADVASKMFDENSAEVETIIMEGEFVRSAIDKERLAAESDARSQIDEYGKLADTYALNRDNLRGGRRRYDPSSYTTIAGVVVLALVLIGQVVHGTRDSLATYGFFNQTMGPVYRMLGKPITPQWDIKGWQFESTTGSTDENEQVLTVFSRLVNKSEQPLPFPLVHVSLTDRWEEVIGSRVLEPNEYLAGDLDPSKPVTPGENFTAVITIASPSEEATGFKLDVCYRVSPGRVRCANEDFKN